MNKKVLTLLLAVFCFTAIAAEDVKKHLVVWTKDGSKAVYVLADQPKVTFEGKDMVIKSKDTEYRYPQDEITRFTYEAVPSETSLSVNFYNQIVRPGETCTMIVYAMFDPYWEGFQLDIILPNGITVAEDDEGKLDVALCRKRGLRHTVTSSLIDGNKQKVHVEVDNTNHFVLNEGYGPLLEVKLVTDANFSFGGGGSGLDWFLSSPSSSPKIVISELQFVTNLLGKATVHYPELTADVVAAPQDHQLYLYLYKGWNWISQNTENTKLTQTFLNPITQMERLVGTKGELINDSQFGIVGNLTELSPTEGYRLKMAEEQTYNAAKGVWCWPEDYPIVLKKGWNWIGYLPYEDMTVTHALSALTPQENDRIQGADAFAEYKNGKWTGSLQLMRPGTAYHYHAGAAATFSYPTSNPSNSSSSNEGEIDDLGWLLGAPQLGAPWSYDAHRYPDVTSVIARLEIDGQPAEEWMVGAFCGEECRGIAQSVDDVLFLTIHGTVGAADTIRFMACHPFTGEQLEIDGHLIFDESCLGHIDDPLLLQAKGMVTDIDHVTVSRPSVSFEDGRLVFNSPLSANATVSLYSLNGTLVFKKTVQSAGEYSFPLPNLNTGVYVVTVNGLTYKIVKR